MFDLVSRDPRRRDAALVCHARSRAELVRAQRAMNEVWWEAGKSWSPADPILAVSMRAARAAHTAAVANTLHGVVGEFRAVRWAGDLDDYRRLAPYAVLFLQWEAHFPEQWRSAGPWSPWGLKKRVLRQFADMDVPQPQITAVTELTLGAVNRGQRCGDLGYVLVARSLDGPVLRDGIEAAACSPDPAVQRRAGYVRWAMDNADSPVTLASWRAWLPGIRAVGGVPAPMIFSFVKAHRVVSVVIGCPRWGGVGRRGRWCVAERVARVAPGSLV